MTAIAIAGGALSGCVSTQDKNARAKLVAARELASRRAQRAAGREPRLRVTAAALVRGRGATVVVVTLRSSAATALTDVPIAVGVRGRDGRRTRLNAARGLDWFQTHVPAVGAGETTTWVFLTRRALAPGLRAWARLGAARGTADALPQVAARPAGRGARRRARVALTNGDVPQYGLQVYALVQRDGRYVAAGKASVRHLGSGERATTGVALVGDPGRRPVRVHAAPTIFE